MGACAHQRAPPHLSNERPRTSHALQDILALSDKTFCFLLPKNSPHNPPPPTHGAPGTLKREPSPTHDAATDAKRARTAPFSPAGPPQPQLSAGAHAPPQAPVQALVQPAASTMPQQPAPGGAAPYHFSPAAPPPTQQQQQQQAGSGAAVQQWQ